jgi:polyisoprenyl-phosphate glycosyltransferase
METPQIGILIPCFNEELVIPETSYRLEMALNELTSQCKIKKDSFIAFVDDGSKDKTWEIIQKLNKKNNNFKGMKLSRNFGHQYALLAGLEHYKNKADCIISMDADLQDDTDILKEFINKFIQGNEIVYGVRDNRDQDSFFKKSSALLFYQIMKKLGVNIIVDHADYRLASKKALNSLSSFSEVNLFLRGIFPLIGLKSDIVYYKRHKRFAGETKYPFKKMVRFALEGITSFSTIPLRVVTLTGISIFLISIAISGYYFIQWSKGNALPGWFSTVLPIYFLGSIQVLSIGIIGEYLGKVYKETKNRPRYILDEVLN